MQGLSPGLNTLGLMCRRPSPVPRQADLFEIVQTEITRLAEILCDPPGYTRSRVLVPLIWGLCENFPESEARVALILPWLSMHSFRQALMEVGICHPSDLVCWALRSPRLLPFGSFQYIPAAAQVAIIDAFDPLGSLHLDILGIIHRVRSTRSLLTRSAAAGAEQFARQLGALPFADDLASSTPRKPGLLVQAHSEVLRLADLPNTPGRYRWSQIIVPVLWAVAEGPASQDQEDVVLSLPFAGLASLRASLFRAGLWMCLA